MVKRVFEDFCSTQQWLKETLVSMRSWFHCELPFYNSLVEKPYITHLHDIDFLRELSFYNEFSIVKTSKAFRGYARSYRIEIIDSKDPSVQLTISKASIEDLFRDLLDEIKGFKYQITLKVSLSKYKENTDREYAPFYFNSTINMILIYLVKKFLIE